jgi:hypothetical protein
MKRAAYRWLIWLHPRTFRERFGAEMLSIYDDAAGRQDFRLFADSVTSLIRQWLFHSDLWKPLAGAALSILVVLSCAYSLKSSFDKTLRRGNPRRDAELRRRYLSEQGRTQNGTPAQLLEAAATQTGGTAALSNRKVTGPVDAIPGIVAAFQQHPVVMIGEDHWLREVGDFYIQLVRDVRFQQSVQDIVVEFASRNNQSLLDRYIAGEDVPTAEVRHIWRDTTKVASWESPIYAEWLGAIRDVNKTLPPNRRLRVLAADTAVHWSGIRTHSDWEALGDNSLSFADVIIEQVLRKKHHALVVLGTNHVLKAGDRDQNDNTTTRVEAQQRGSTYVALLICHGGVANAAQDILRLPNLVAPALVELAGLLPGKPMNYGEIPLSKEADALLYLGPPESLTMAFPPPGSLEPEYLQEVDRRSMIEWGELRARKFLGAAAR